MKVTDLFLSRETFQVVECRECGFRYLNPRPCSDEIGRYYQSEEYISHDAKKGDLFSRAYRLARRISIRRKYTVVSRTAKPATLLDYGCGTGEFLRYCQMKGVKVTGIEPNEKARNFAIEQYGIPVIASLAGLDPAAGLYDCITLWHVLEHVHDLDGTLEKITRILTPGGTLVIAVPNCLSGDARKYGEFWAAYDVPRHLYHFTPGTLRRLMERHGFTVQQTLPQKLDAYYISLLSEKYRSGTNRYFNAVLSGIRSNLLAKREGWGHSSIIFLLSAKKA